MKPSDRLFNRNFLLVWQGQLVSQIGSQAFAVASAFWIKHQTESATLVGLILMLGTLPIVLLGPLGGVVADRASRKQVIVACDALAGAAVLSLAWIMWLHAEPTALVIGWLCVAATMVGITRAFFGPALRAVIPSVAPAPRLRAANALHDASTEASALAGQAAGGVAFQAFGAPVLFLIDGVSYLYAALATAAAAIPHTPSPAISGTALTVRQVRADLSECIRYVRRESGLRALVLLAAIVNCFAAPVFVLLPFFVEDVLHRGPDVYGVLIAAFGAGGLAGYALAARSRSDGAVRAVTLLAALVTMAVCVGTLGLVHHAGAALALFVCAGACNGFFGVSIVTRLQESTPDAMRGRVFGLLYTLAMAPTPVAMLVTGLAADAMGRNVRIVFVACGFVLVVAAGCAALHRGLRRYLAAPPPIS